jgi:hypothetical protein
MPHSSPSSSHSLSVISSSSSEETSQLESETKEEEEEEEGEEDHGKKASRERGKNGENRVSDTDIDAGLSPPEAKKLLRKSLEEHLDSIEQTLNSSEESADASTFFGRLYGRWDGNFVASVVLLAAFIALASIPPTPPEAFKNDFQRDSSSPEEDKDAFDEALQEKERLFPLWLAQIAVEVRACELCLEQQC